MHTSNIEDSLSQLIYTQKYFLSSQTYNNIYKYIYMQIIIAITQMEHLYWPVPQYFISPDQTETPVKNL